MLIEISLYFESVKYLSYTILIFYLVSEGPYRASLVGQWAKINNTNYSLDIFVKLYTYIYFCTIQND